MSDVPWQTDRALDEHMVREAVLSQFPSIAAATVESIGDGWDFDVYEIDERWVFRFPKRREYDARFLTELALLDMVAGELPTPVPGYTFRGTPCEAFPYHFGGYAKLRGQCATGVEPSGPGEAAIAAQVGELLRCVHTCDVDRLSKLGLYGLADEGSADAQRRETLGHLAKLKADLPAATHERCVELFGDPSQMPPPYEGGLCLIHGDLLPGHILVDSVAERVTGVIDWTDAALSDPAGDFVGIWMWCGDDFVERTLKSYGRPIDDHMRRRIRYRGLSVAVSELYYAQAHGYGSYAQFCQNCLRREFDGG